MVREKFSSWFSVVGPFCGMIRLLLLFAFLPVMTSAQKPIEVRYTQDSKGNYNFICENRAYCHYIIQVGLTDQENIRSSMALPLRREVEPGITTLFTLSPENRDKPVKFHFTSGYLKGCLNSHPDSGFIYLLPMAPGKQAQAFDMQGQQKASPGAPQIRDWYMVRFKVNPGDTLYAARRGVVTAVDVSGGSDESGTHGSEANNFIDIVHADCSFGHYGILKKNGAMVRPGQTVEAGMPIGLVGGDKYGRGSEIRFGVSYNEESQQAGGGELQYEIYLPLYFWIKYKGKEKLKHGADYLCEHPANLVAQEKAKTAPSKKKTANGK